MLIVDKVIERGEFGLDTVRIGGEATRRTISRRQISGWRVSSATDEVGRGVDRSMLRTLECGATLQFLPARRGDVARGFVEFSVPKLLRGDNVHPSSLSAARIAVSAVLREAGDFVELHQTKVNRLDVVRDFTDVANIGGILLALMAAPISGRKTFALYGDAAVGGIQTRVVWNNDGGCRAYDKGVESGLPEAQGRLRVEAEERRRHLRLLDITSWDAVTERDIYAVGRRRFEWAGLDATIRSVSAAITLILASKLNGATICKLVGYHELHRLGLDSELTSSDRSRFRRDLEALGAFGCEHADQPFRLDYDRGLLIGDEVSA
jgi:hypothetical protein